MKKNILIVGGGPEITICYDLINNSTEYNFFSVSEIPTMYPELFVETIETSFRNFGKTIEQIKELKYSIDAVACWDEALTHIADDISKELGLNPISSLDSQSFRFKDRMRMVCEAGGLKMPKYKIINQFSDTNKIINWKYPLIVKPTSFLASIGVKKVYNFSELQQAVSQMLNVKFPVYIASGVYELGELYNLEPRVLVEEFIDGEEYSLESVVRNGIYTPLGITKKIVDEKLFMDEIGYIFPSNLNKEEKSRVYSWAEKLHQILQLNHITTHTEFRIGRNGDIILIEIGARIGGDCIPNLMKNSFIVKGFDFYNTYLKARLGLQEELNTDTNKFSGIVFFRLNPENYGKIFNGVSYDAPKTSLIFEEKIYKKEGTVLPNPINWSNERVGYVCLENKEYAVLEKEMKEILKSLSIE